MKNIDEAKEWVHSHSDDDPLDDEDLVEVFTIIYERLPDADDKETGLWSLICAAVDP